MKSLCIISHTEHYKTADGTLVGWGPTITEINHLLEIFDTIYHIGMLHETEAPVSALPYVSDRIIFVPLPVLGGETMFAKAQLLWKSPTVLRIIKSTLKKADWFQFRAPTGMGVYVIPFLSLCINKPGWFKYAGNWIQQNPPLGYRFQRWMLKQQGRKVTLNGSWVQQPRHSLTFENPCLTDLELMEGSDLSKQKSIEGQLTCCFVGRLEKPKGVERIIQALEGLSVEDKKRINAVHLVGDGLEMSYFKALAKQSGVDFIFHGALARDQVFEIYKKSQVFLMPTTASEGFPKVIAEAMNFGCLPIVSNISAIGQYIKNFETGICLGEVTTYGVQKAIEGLLKMDNKQYHYILTNQRSEVLKFSFKHYNHRIKTDIIF
ncbi:MAG: glycosyltransferase [Ferruginibacter sp.]